MADEYDSGLTNNLLAQASQKTDEQAKTQAEQNKGQGKSTGTSGTIGTDIKKDAQTAGKVAGKVLGAFKKGGTVPETGNFTLHKGEEVVPAKRASEYRKVFLARGSAGKHKWNK